MDSCAQLLAAMNDTSVDRVLLRPVPGGWSCGEDVFPRWAVRVRHRNLTMEGKGPVPVYFNVRALVEGLLAARWAVGLRAGRRSALVLPRAARQAPARSSARSPACPV